MATVAERTIGASDRVEVTRVAPASNLDVVLVDVSWLKAHEEFIPTRYQVILQEIKANNAYQWPILVDSRSGVILDGHHRHQVALTLKLKKVPAVLIDYLNDERIEVVRWRKELENWKSKGVPDTVSSSNAPAPVESAQNTISITTTTESTKPAEKPVDDILVTKEEVVRRGIAGELYGPKSTRHLSENLSMPQIYVPLTQLY